MTASDRLIKGLEVDGLVEGWADVGEPARPHFRRERALLRRGTGPVAGVDEVGRGPLAGPVAAAAVSRDLARVPRGLNDSKALTAAAREALFEVVMETALGVGVAFASAAEIDRVNIRQATFLAMRRALAALALTPGYILVDGNDLPNGLCCAGEAVIRGDASSASIAAASIVAKVSRDRLMRRLCVHHPVYGFSRHVGYGTRQHRAALAEHGPCLVHRLTFAPLRGLVSEGVQSTVPEEQRCQGDPTRHDA